MLRRDYLMRLIEQAGDALRRAAGQRATGEEEAAAKTLDGALVDLLDRQAGLFLHTTPETAARMLQDPDRVRMAARIYAAKADLQDAADAIEAARLRFRAAALYLEARAEGASADEALDALTASLPDAALDERARSLRARFTPRGSGAR